MKDKLSWLPVLFLLVLQTADAQNPFRIEGTGLFNSPSGTSIDLLNTDDNTNALLRFGDNNVSKTSLGFNGNDDVFKFSTATTLGANDLTMTLTGLMGINTLPGAHRMLINQNSTSGLAGATQLYLQENNVNDFARLRFSNLGDDGAWLISGNAVGGSSRMHFYYSDGLNAADLMSLDGDNFRVGIHQINPEGYLHIKQQFAGVDALAFVNDNATGGDKWSFRIGDEDILIYFNNDIRGGFDVSTGNYNNFPPAPALAGQTKMKDDVLGQLMQLRPRTISQEKSNARLTGFNPAEVNEINPDWLVRSEDGKQDGIDYLQFAILALKAIQEQQELIKGQQEKIAGLKKRKALQEEQLVKIEMQLKKLGLD